MNFVGSSLDIRSSHAMAKAQELTSHRLTDGWLFKQADDTGEDAWLSVKTVPTNVHLDLIEHGK